MVHPDWSGETVALLGGGESLKSFDPVCLNWAGWKVAAINEAGLSLAPAADLLFWSDVRWVNWNIDRLEDNHSPLRYTCQEHRIAEIPRARHIEFVPRLPNGEWNAFDRDPERIGGHDSGTKAINLLYHLRAARVVLLGFDMHDYDDEWRRGSWHDKHELPPLTCQRTERFIPAHERMAAALPDGFEVVNATPGSALECWPLVRLEELL